MAPRNMNAIPVPALTLDPAIEGILAEMAAKQQAEAKTEIEAGPEPAPAEPKAQSPAPAKAPETAPGAPAMPVAPAYQMPDYGAGAYDPGMTPMMPMAPMTGMGNPYALPDIAPVEIPEPSKQSAEDRYAQIEALMRQNRPYTSFGDAVKKNWLPLALVGGLSMLTNGRRGLANIGQAGLDALTGLSGAMQARQMQQQQLVQNALKLQGLRDEAAQRDQNEKYRYAALGLQAQDHALQRAIQEGQLGVAQGNLMMRMNEEARRQNDRAMLGNLLGFGMGGGLMPQGAPGALPARQPGQNLPMANNNPLNLRHSAVSAKNGGIQGHGNFAYFPTPEQGARAAIENLQTPRFMAADGTGSIAQIAPMWVEGHGLNDAAFWQANPAKLKGVQEYILNVARDSGFDPNARINLKDPAQLARLTAAMGKWEGFQGDPGVFQRAAYGQMPQQGQPMPQAAPAQGGMVPAGQTPPEMLQQRKRAAIAMMASGDEGMRAIGRTVYEDASKAEAAAKPKFTELSTLGKWYSSESANYNMMGESLSKMFSAVKGKSGPDDLSIIFNFMRVLDPNSVVREGEQMMARQTGGAADQYVALFNRIKNGESLTPEMRNNFLRSALGMFDAVAGPQKSRDEMFTSLITSQFPTVKPSDVFRNNYLGIGNEVRAYLAEQDKLAQHAASGGPRMGGGRGASVPVGLPPDARPIN